MSDRPLTLGEILSAPPEYGANAMALPPDGLRPRYLRITDIDDAGRLLHEDIRSIPTAVAAPYLLQTDDIVIARTGNTVGKCYRHVQRDGPLAFAGYLIRFRIDPNKADPGFVFHFLHSPDYQAWIGRTIRTGAQPNINASEYKRLELPPFGPMEQRQIAKILSTLDDTIVQTEALIAKYQQIKAGLMQDLFTRGVTIDGRLRATRARAPELYKSSDLGWIPKDWQVKKLGAILKESEGYLQTGPFGSQLHAHEYLAEGIPVVMPQDINNGSLSTEQIARIGAGKAQELSRHRMRLGDVVIARRGDLSRAAAISDVCEGWVCGTGCFLLRLRGGVLRPEFAAAVYRHAAVQRQIAGLAVGTTMPSLNNHVMERLLFYFCDIDEQDRILEALHAVDQNLIVMQRRVGKLAMEKLGLMHDLLTGRVSVKVAELEEASA